MAPQAAPSEPGESPAVPVHVEQTQIDAGTLGLGALEDAGRNIFLAKFNSLDGAGRPMTDGAGNPRPAICGTARQLERSSPAYLAPVRLTTKAWRRGARW